MAAAAIHPHSSQADPLAFVTTSLSLIESIHALEQPLRTACARAQVNKQQCNTMFERVEEMMPLLGEIEGELQQGSRSRDQLDSTESVHSLKNNQPQLEFMLAAVVDALVLISKFSSAATLRRLWERSDYSDDFASINEMLLEAQFDLRFGLEKTGLFNPQRDARDAKADLAHISDSIDQIVQSVEDGVSSAGAVDSMESVSSSLPNPAALPSVFPAVRFDSEAAKQTAIDKWQQRVAAEIRVIEQRSLAPAVVAASASASSSASSSSSSAAVPLRTVTSDLLHIPLSDLTLDPRPVGFGGYGDVYRALWISHDCIVAVKRLHVAGMTDPMLEAFYSELTVLHGLPRHAHIVGLLGAVVDEPSRTYLMVMEWMEQGSLYDYLRLHRRSPDGGASFPLLSRLRMCLQCAAAVNHLHLLRPPKGPVIHRDIKSPNILIDKFGEIKLADFGLAKIRAASTIVSSAAHIQKQAVGTLPWMAPEHLRPGGKKSSTTASDVYALGVVLWEIITLQVPYDDDDDETIKDSIKGGPDNKLTIPDSVPPKLRSLLQACWVNNPKQRPSCSELIHALKLLIAEEESLQLSASSVVAPAVVTAAAAAPYSPAHSALGSSEIADFDRLQALREQVTNMQTGESAAQQSVEAPSTHLTEVLSAVGFSHARHPLSAGSGWIATEERNLSSVSAAPPLASGIAASSAAPLHPRSQPSDRDPVDSAQMVQLRDGVTVQQAEAEANGGNQRESNYELIETSSMQPPVRAAPTSSSGSVHQTLVSLCRSTLAHLQQTDREFAIQASTLVDVVTAVHNYALVYTKLDSVSRNLFVTYESLIQKYPSVAIAEQQRLLQHIVYWDQFKSIPRTSVVIPAARRGQPASPAPIAALVVAASSVQSASSASASRPSEDRSVSDAFARVSSLRVRCLFVADDDRRTLRVSGAEVFAARRGSQKIDVFPVASADHPKAVPIRSIDVGLLVADFALQPDGQRLFVTGQAADSSPARLISLDSRTGQRLRSVALKSANTIAVNATQVFCAGFTLSSQINVFSLDLEPIGCFEQDPKWAELSVAQREDLTRQNPPAIWIRSVAAICCFEDRVFVADNLLSRVSVWSATTLKHLFNFGRRRTEEEMNATRYGEAPPAGTFRDIHSICVYRHVASSPPVLVIADSCLHLLVYALHSDQCKYIGAQRLPLWRIVFSLSSGGALGSDLWVVSSRSGPPPLSDLALKQFRSSLKVGDEVDFKGADGWWCSCKITRFETHWFLASEVWLELRHRRLKAEAVKVEIVKTLLDELWPAGTKSKTSHLERPQRAYASALLEN